MKRKKLPSKKHKGLNIYCSKCKKEFSWTQKIDQDTNKLEPLCGLSTSKLSRCKNIDNHKYKVRVHVPGGGSAIVSKVLDGHLYNDAVVEAIEFKRNFLADLFQTEEPTQRKRRLYLFNAQIAYLDFLNNVGLPEHEIVQRGQNYINEQQYCLKLFNKALAKKEINTKLITFDQITDAHVGLFHRYLLEDMNYKNLTYNTKMNSLRGFFKVTIDRSNLDMKNPFEKVKRRSSTVNRDTVTKEEFYAMLALVTRENGYVTEGKDNQPRNRYRPYLNAAFKLGLHTGGRREEIIALRWNMIQEKDGIPMYIAVNNLKVERNKGDGFNDNVKPKIIPVTKGLMSVLNELGYECYKGSNRFMIVPDRSKIRDSGIVNAISRGFGHFYNLLENGKELKFKCLRKTYLTYLSLAAKGDTKTLSSHASDDILKKHYIDERVVSNAVKEVNIFG